ncbi:MAG: Do family serine endopeptidase [Sulfurovum sp.]|nr:MAG: Do family serine endopeptidase [Sulfurovum sp.]
MKKILFLSTLTFFTLYAGEISFSEAAPNPLHKTPVKQNEIFSFHDAIKDSIHAVVNISIKVHSQIDPRGSRLFQDPFFERFFGEQFRRQVPRERIQRALGSGVILSKDGYIVTNNHVVSNADEITVTLHGSDKEYSAKLIGTDKGSDLAVIKIEAKDLKPIKLAQAKDIRLGDVVFAIGNPFAIGETVTQGIVSALNKHSMGINQYENFIQTDASINPGNSGGALVDSRGALIGINSAIISRSGGNNGIGFAIPVDMMRNVVTNLVDKGKVERGYMGVHISKVTKKLKPLYRHKKGAVITDVEKGSAADKSGLQRGDLIIKVDERSVESPASLQNIVASLSPGKTISIELERNRKILTVPLKLASRDSVQSVSKILEGATLSTLDHQKRRDLRLSAESEGVVVVNVVPSSKAAKDGFHVGDVIIQVEGSAITSMKDLKRALQADPQDAKRVYINRHGLILLLVIS